MALKPDPKLLAKGGVPPVNTTGLSGADRDAAVLLTNLFTSYGLGSLANDILGFIKSGYSPDTISIMLQQTDAYKQRFAANAARQKAGLPVLSPADYLNTEKAYRDIMANAGLPPGFYDQPSDFQKFLENDTSPTEVAGRVQAAADIVNQGDPATLAAFQQFYGMGKTDVIAYALDGAKAMPLIQKQLKAAQIAGAAGGQGLTTDQATAEHLASEGITAQQAQAGFGQVAGELPTVNKLNSIYGADVTQQDLVSSVFDSNAAATEKRRKLASQERGAFSGSSSQSRGTLGQDGSGAL